MKNNILIGANTADKLPELLRAAGTKVLLVHGHRPVEDGLLKKVRLILNEAKFPYANMGQILPNPKYGSVKRGIRIARKEKCDIVLALGGGSTLQCAKGIALGMGYKGDVWDFWTGKKTPKKVYPIGSILTNPASSAELSQACTLVRKGRQETVRDEKLVCTFAILDPMLAMYPVFPTMNQVFILFMRLFTGALDGADCMPMMKELLESADALSKDIRNVDARTSLFKIGYESHISLPHDKCPVERLANQLAFSYSLTEGSAASALFLSWLKQLPDDEKKKATEIINDLSANKAESFDDAVNNLKQILEPTHLGLSIPETGLIISNKELKKLAQTKQDRQILVNANK